MVHPKLGPGEVSRNVRYRFRINMASSPLRIDFSGGSTDVSPIPELLGGHVVNCAIDVKSFGKLVTNRLGIGLPGSVFKSYTPVKCPSGLGASSSLTAVQYLTTRPLILESRDVVARKVVEIERLGFGKGVQDVLATVHGGLNSWTYNKRTKWWDKKVLADPKSSFIRRLNFKMNLVYVCPKILSTELFKPLDEGAVRKRVKNDIPYRKVLESIRDNSISCEQAILAKDYYGLIACLNNDWELRKMLSPWKTNECVERFIEYFRERCQGVKLCGSAGGGYALVLGREKIVMRLAAKWFRHNRVKDLGVKNNLFLRVRINWKGSHVHDWPTHVNQGCGVESV